MAISLEYYWKKSFDPQKPTPFGMLCSFYDLMCYWDNVNKIDLVRFNMNSTPSNFKMKGYELPHNIIKFDTNIYQQDPSVNHRVIIGSLNPSPGATSFDEFQLGGIDVSMPRFDLRSKPLYLTPANVGQYIPGVTSAQMSAFLSAFGAPVLDPSDFYYGLGPGLKVWDKNAIMKPLTSYDFYTHSPNYSGTMNPAVADTWTDYSVDNAFYIASEKDGTGKFEGCDICLNNEDLSFEARFLNDPAVTGIYAYNGLCFNYTSNRVWNIMKKQYKFSKPGALQNPISVNGLGANIEPIWRFLMVNTYVFVKASFFADYVDYKDFDQTLNKTSTVIHKELLVSPVGDLARYNTAYSAGTISANELARNTRPYISKTTPSIDLVGPLALPDGQYVDNPTNINTQRSTVQKIIDNSNGPDSKIGALNVEPFELYNPDVDDGITNGEQIPPPPVYFDPESRKPASSYNDIPIVVSKDGNVQISGRFIGPTIDELWQEIKMLIAGRMADINASGTAVDRPDGGYPTGTTSAGKDYRINVDTRPVIKNHALSTPVSSSTVPSIGDPVDISYNFNNPQQALYSVVKWVNNPTIINYKNLMEIDSLNDLLCQAVGTGASKTWKKITAEINHLTKPSETSDPVVNARYRPSDNPLSLRELEGIVKGLQWNLSYLLSFMVRNNTWAGSVGYFNDDVPATAIAGDVEGGDYYRPSVPQYIGHAYNVNNGSAYQLHKDYDGNYAKANTRYDQRANNGTYNASTNPYGMPTSAVGRGLEPITDRQTPDNQDIVPSWAVFMSAAGTWVSPGYQFAQVPIYTRAEEEF